MFVRYWLMLSIGCLIGLFIHCSDAPGAPDAPDAPPPKYIGDLPELEKRGVLRVIVPEDLISHMPRQAEQVTLDYDIARDLADALKLDLVLVATKDYSRMLEKLLAGEGDLIAASLTVTPGREAQVAFSLPYYFVDEYLIMAKSDRLPATIEALNDIVISTRQSSSYYETLLDLKQQASSVRIHTVPETLTTADIVDSVANGTYEATIYDSNFWNAISGDYENLATPITITEDRPVGLAMRPGDTRLKEKVDEFLHARALTPHLQETYTDDLEGLKKHRRLRMITRNNAMTYFIHRGRQVGFEYELMKKFAKSQGLQLDIVIPDSHGEMMSYLQAGQGDVIAAAMTIDTERLQEAAMTRPYIEMEELVVVRAEETGISGWQDMAGRTVHVRESSSFYQTLQAMQDSVAGLKIAILPDDMETEEILEGVAEGLYDITLCDSNLLDTERAYGRPLKAAFSIKPTHVGWAVRKDNPNLLAALNQFIEQEYRSMFYNMMQRRYFKNTRTISKARDSLRVDLSSQLSPFDSLVKTYAKRFDLDWRLISAQMYQESRFDPNAVSWVGAQGLMQVMPRTGAEIGFTDLKDPETGIHAGVKYLHMMIDRFDPSIPMNVRVHFALASYNAGYGHVLDARRLAGKMGWDKGQWFGHVERAMLLLAKPQYAQRARYGYCRGGEPVQYVRNIQNLYEAYVETLNAAG